MFFRFGVKDDDWSAQSNGFNPFYICVWMRPYSIESPLQEEAYSMSTVQRHLRLGNVTNLVFFMIKLYIYLNALLA